MMPLIEFQSVSKYFTTSSGLFGRGEVFPALNNVSLTVNEGEFLGIVGESGSGKSTAARLICSLYEPDSGSILFKGKNILSLNKDEYKQYRKSIQMVFQNPDSSLNPKLTIRSALSDGIKQHITKNKTEINNRLEYLMDKVGLPHEYLDRYPHEFSGGQRQRISIARALSIEPELIIADEPVSSLDVSVQAQILNLMKSLQKSGITFILISHSLAVVSNICDNVAVFCKGEMVEYGRVEEVLKNPATDYTKKLLHASEYINIK